jgi:hypothetical protein
MNSRGSSFHFLAEAVFEFAGSGRGEEPSGEKILRLIQIRVTMSSLAKITLIRQAEKTHEPATVALAGAAAARMQSMSRS